MDIFFLSCETYVVVKSKKSGDFAFESSDLFHSFVQLARLFYF